MLLQDDSIANMSMLCIPFFRPFFRPFEASGGKKVLMVMVMVMVMAIQYTT